MTISSEIAHLRALLNARGVKIDRIAKKAGLSWCAVKAVADGTGDPKGSTLCAIESAMDADPPSSTEERAA